MALTFGSALGGQPQPEQKTATTKAGKGKPKASPKQKVVTEAQPDLGTPEIVEKAVIGAVEATDIDELAELTAWEKEYSEHPNFKRLATLRKVMTEAAKSMSQADGNAELIFRGATHEVVFSPVAKTRKVTDLKKAHELLGDKFYDGASITLKFVDDYLNPEQRAEVCSDGEGSRRMKEIRPRTV